MPSIFTRIIEREIPAHILHEDDYFLAFLDVRPIREGHTLVVSKTEIRRRFDLSDPAAQWTAAVRATRSQRRSSR